MTILTKASIVIKKPDGIKSPLVLDDQCVCDEEKITMYPPSPEVRQPAKRSTGALFCMTFVATLVALTGASCGLILYRQYLRSGTVHRYQGYCSIPLDAREFQEPQADQLIEPNYREHRVIPLHWSSEPFQVASVAGDEATRDFINTIYEEFEIGDNEETVRVNDNGKSISFVHDFGENMTGIIDSERCFVMDLDPESVLSPELFVLSIEAGDQFDVSRVRSSVRAVLPALRDLARRARLLHQACADRPVYRLQRDQGPTIRKRSADAPPHDYIQFAGKHVQEIEISNLAELLQFEQQNAN